MLCMALVEAGGLDMEGGGEVLVDGPTDTDLIGDGVVIGGEVLALVLGAPTTSVVGAASVFNLLCPYY